MGRKTKGTREIRDGENVCERQRGENQCEYILGFQHGKHNQWGEAN